MARGGKRTPADPAPVSGPGALSQRTDGGPTQAPQSFPAQFQGQRQGLAELQGAAPMEGGSGAPPVVGQGSPLPPGISPEGILGPTNRPMEPVDAGSAPRRVIPNNPDALIDALYAAYPHPDIAALRRR
jgi:hypothetical protein